MTSQPQNAAPSASTPQAPAVRSRMDYIDALRGAACLWVLLHHSIGQYPGASHLPLQILVKIADLGWLGVSLFLVLSGFCLYYPLVRRNEPAAIRLDLKTFAKRRAWRILPPYYAAMACYLFLAALHHHLGATAGGWKNISAHLLMLHNLHPRTIGGINPAFWSLALESQLYIIFPALVILAARRGFFPVVALTFCISVVWQCAVYSRLGFSPDWVPRFAATYHALPGRCFEFAAGMVVAALVAAPKPQHVRVAAVTLAVLLVPAIYYALFVSRFGPFLDQIWGVIFCCLIVLLNRIPHDLFQSRLVLRFLTWVGTISYSLYLIHNAVFYELPLPTSSDSILIFSMLGRITLTIALAALFFRMFERPFIVRRKATQAEIIQATALSPAP